MAPEPAAFMEDFKQMIREARIMLRSADAAQRERGRAKLRDVLREAEGSSYAREAHNILTSEERPLTPPAVVDAELRRLEEEWPSIQGFDDHHLGDFLRRLEAYPGTAVPLRTEVIRDLRKLIADELPQVGPGMPQTRAAALNDFVAAVRGVAAYEELPEFGQLCDRLFNLRLRETAGAVDAALKSWSLRDAWALLDKLGPPPEGFRAEVERLQAEVGAVDALHRAVQGLLRQLPEAAPGSWLEARDQAKSLEQLRQYLSDVRVPAEPRERLEAASVRLATAVEGFVREQAQAAITVRLLRDFRSEFESLPQAAEGSWEANEAWFATGLETIRADASRRAERALTPDELAGVANSLRVETEGVPPAVAARAREMADAVARTAAAWKAMRDGQVFELPVPEPEAMPVPSACRAEAPRYAEWLRRIEGAFERFKGDAPLGSEQDYEDAERLAADILRQSSNHALARKLQLEAARRISCYQLDRALGGWNLESFFELLGNNNPGEIYSALAADREVLAELRSQTLHAPFADWRTASAWWDAWRAAERRLPSARPDALLHALARQTEERRQQWYAALEKLLKEELPPREYDAAAASLADESDTNLQTYQQELRRKATIGRIVQHIKGERLEEAERELSKLPSGSTDAARLRTHLMLAQARGRGGAAAAEFLSSEWSNVQRHVERPHEVLLETVQAVWTQELQGWLGKMAQLLSRVLGRGEPGDATTRELADWQTWLEIEDGLLQTFSSGAVKQLADYLRGVRPGTLLDQRLGKLLRHWEAEKNTVMLAWAHQAFAPRSEAAAGFDRAADDLLAESDLVAEQVLGVLAGRAELELADIKPLQDSLRREEERWQSLDDYLGLYLPHPVVQRQPSATFARAKSVAGELSKILSGLARLKDADLSEDPARMEFEEADSRALRIKGVAARERLLNELDRLRPLLELYSPEERLRETAEKCRSKMGVDVNTSGLFAKMAEYVREVIDVFVKAGAKDGAMWRLVSAKYEALVYREACVLLAPSGRPELERLAETLDELNAEEAEFTRAIAMLGDRDREPKVAWGGAFDPEPHLEYISLIPAQPPRSLKVYNRFDRARRDTLKFVLEAPESRPYLPQWVREYLDNGVPACANEH